MILIEPKRQQQQRRRLKLQFLTWTRSLNLDVHMRKKIVLRTARRLQRHIPSSILWNMAGSFLVVVLQLYVHVLSSIPVQTLEEEEGSFFK